MSVEVKKIPPVECPQCKSPDVSTSFVRRQKVKRRSINCRVCKKRTLDDGSIEKFDTDATPANKFWNGAADPWKDTGDYFE